MNYELLIEAAEAVYNLPLTKEDYEGIERLLQWPEDLEEYDRHSAPINLDALCGGW